KVPPRQDTWDRLRAVLGHFGKGRMKSRLIAFLSITSIILAGVSVWQQRELREMKSRLSKMAADFQAESDARKEQEHRTTALNRRESALSQQVMELSGLAANLRSSESQYASNYARLAKQ